MSSPIWPHSSRAPVTRRGALGLVASVALLPVPPGHAQLQTEAQTARAIEAITKGAAVTAGRVKLVLPELAENGNVVSLAVTVDSPMTADDYVRAIYIISDKNPIADVIRFHLTPRAGRAKVSTNIRLATTQVVTALAETNTGTFWSTQVEVIVTLAACLDSG